MNCKRVGRGRTTVLTPEDEEYLVYGIQYLADYGWGVDTAMLKEIGPAAGIGSKFRLEKAHEGTELPRSSGD